MKREILFRGKRVATATFVYGFYVILANRNHSIVNDNGNFWIIPETVGQFTGLIDKNGKKIFEGDIIRGRHWTSYNDKNPEDFHLWRVDWNEKSGLIIFVDSPTSKARLSIHDFADFGEVEVIGNIHDNPELLEGGVENAAD